MRAIARAKFNGHLEGFMSEAIDELGVFWFNVEPNEATSSQLEELDYARLCLIAVKYDVLVVEEGVEECEVEYEDEVDFHAPCFVCGRKEGDHNPDDYSSEGICTRTDLRED